MVVGNFDMRTELSNVCHSHHPNLVCISEPMVTFNSIPSIYWNSLDLSLLTANNRGDLLPNNMGELHGKAS